MTEQEVNAARKQLGKLLDEIDRLQGQTKPLAMELAKHDNSRLVGKCYRKNDVILPKKVYIIVVGPHSDFHDSVEVLEVRASWFFRGFEPVYNPVCLGPEWTEIPRAEFDAHWAAFKNRVSEFEASFPTVQPL